MNDNTTLLQKEIERLNFIISLLIEKNRELERKLQSISLQNTSPRRPFLSDQENREELNTTNGSILPQAELINGEIHNPSVKAIESNQSAYSNVKELEQSNQSAEPKSSTDIDINMVHPENIYRLLRKKMPHAKRAAAHHAALTLIHLYKKNENTHHELSKVTGLTPRGTGKHIMMLKRRGYIVRTSYQCYELTEKALAILRQGFDNLASSNNSSKS